MIIDPASRHCPNCHDVEDTKVQTVCRHCGYVYRQDEDLGCFGTVALIGGFIVVTMWGMGTMLYWLMGGHGTLLEVLVSQWEWAKSIRVW